MVLILYSLFVFGLVATAFIANKIILGVMTPALFVCFRMGISGILLICLFSLSKKVFAIAKKHIGMLALIAFFTTTLPSLLRAYALRSIPSSRAAFWGAFEPFITATYMYFMFNQKLSRKQAVGCALGVFAAIFFTFMQSMRGEVNFTTYLFFSLADIAQIMSVVISRFGWLKAQVLLRENLLKPQQMNGFTFTISACFAFILSFFFGESISWESLASAKVIGAWLYTIIIGNMVAYTLYARLLKNQNATYVSLAGLSVPLFVHVLAHFILDEPLSWVFFVSSGIMFFALRAFYAGSTKSGPAAVSEKKSNL